MAKLVVLAVYDAAVEAHSRPFFVPSIAMGIRSFVDEVNRAAEDNGMYRHPGDYTLEYLADFVEESGEFLTVDKRTLVRAVDVKREA